MSTSWNRHGLLCPTILLIWLGNATPASALDIIPIFNGGASQPTPFDPANAGLTTLFNYAEAYYEDIFEDNHTVTINFWYEDLSGGFIGDHDLVAQSNPPLPFPSNYCSAVITSPSPLCRETAANIRIDTRLNTGGAFRNWFLDFTPSLNEEFNMQQTLWRDIPQNQGDWYAFGPSIPNTFEVGFTGNAVDPTSLAGQGIDMLSTVLHEVGHALGMASANNSTMVETDDGNYDFNPAFVFGRSLAADVRDGSGDSVGHLDNTLAGMNGFNLGSNGLRILQSHTDLFSMAAGHSYVDLDVPRREYYGGTAWNSDGNWSGSTVPASQDDAYVRDGHSAALASNGFARNLFVQEEAVVTTGSHSLTVGGKITIEGVNPGDQATLVISSGGRVAADEIELNQGGILTVTRGAAPFVDGVEVDTLDINAGGVLIGNGIVRTSASVINDGTISAVAGSGGDELIFQLLAPDFMGPIDLDGESGDGEVFAVLGDLSFAVGIADAFDGRMTIGAGREVRFVNNWQVGQNSASDAEIILQGTVPNPAVLNTVLGTATFVGGSLQVNGTGVIEGQSVFAAGSTVVTQNASATLRLNGSTNLAGGQMLGAGTVHQTGDADVTADTTIAVGTYDMDGLSGDSTINVLAARTLRVESTSIESTGGGDGYDGTLNINNGTVDIVAPWILEGTVHLNDTGAGSPELTGTGGVTVQGGGAINFHGGTALVNTPVSVNNGTVFVDANATMNGPTTLGANATVDIDEAGDSLRLRGQTALIAPTIVGSGRLILEDTVNISFADASIGVAETDLDGQLGNTEITINNGLTLSIASTTIEPTANDGFDGTIHNHGTLSILAGWRLDGTLNMDRAAGSSTLNGGPFEIASTGLLDARNDVAIHPNTTVAGTINVTAGRTQINGSATFLPTANVQVTSSGELELNGATAFGGGTYQGQGIFQWDGPVNVLANTNMTLGIVDFDGTNGSTVTTLNDSVLTLNVNQVDTANNGYDGTMNINGLRGGLAVNLNDPTAAWQMNGTINATGGGFLPQNILNGSHVAVSGTINADSVTQTMAIIDLSGSITTADTATEFRFSFGPHVIRNRATVTGLGKMVVNTNGTVLAADGSTIGIDVINRGRFEPGTSTGTATIAANYDQVSSGTFATELAGAPNVDHDLLTVDRTATLAGELEVTAINGFVPTVGSIYTLLTANSVVGTFDALTTLSDSIFRFDATVSYPGTRVVLRITNVSMFGDFNNDLALDCADIDALVAQIASGSMDLQFDLNGDAMVDTSDLNLWLEEAGTFNVDGPYLGGDANLDGNVDGSDFGIWNTNKFTFGNGWCGGDFNADGATDGSDFGIWNVNKFMSSTLASVPEPTTWGSLLLLMAPLVRVGRSQRRFVERRVAALLQRVDGRRSGRA